MRYGCLPAVLGHRFKELDLGFCRPPPIGLELQRVALALVDENQIGYARQHAVALHLCALPWPPAVVSAIRCVPERKAWHTSITKLIDHGLVDVGLSHRDSIG